MNLQDKSCLTARSSSEKQIVTSVSVVISVSSFEKRGIQDLDKILEVILKKQHERQHHVKRCNSSISKSCVLEGCFCGIEDVRQTLKQVLCEGSKLQFVPFDQDLYYFIETNYYEKFEQLRNLCIVFKEHETDYGFIVEIESKMETSAADLQNLLSDLKRQYQAVEFHQTDLMTFDQILSFMKGTETVINGTVELVLNGENGLVKIVGSCDAVLRTKQRYEEHVKAITSDSVTMYKLSGKYFENCEEENPDDDVCTREIPERDENHIKNVLPTVSRNKPEKIENEIEKFEDENPDDDDDDDDDVCTREIPERNESHINNVLPTVSRNKPEEIENEIKNIEEENPDDDDDVCTREIPERNESHISNVALTVSKIKPEEIEIDIRQDENIKSERTNCGDENAFHDVHTREIPERSESRGSNDLSTVSRIESEETEIDIRQNENIKSEGTNCGDENAFQTGENYHETSHAGKQEIINEEESEQKDTSRDINKSILKTVDSATMQNTSKIYDKLDMEKLCGEDDRIANKETGCYEIEKIPEINGRDDKVFQTGEHYGKNQNTADAEENVDLLCDKTRISCSCFVANYNETCSKINVDCKEDILPSMENDRKEHGTMTEMMKKTQTESISNFAPKENSALALKNDDEIQPLFKKEGIQQMSSEIVEPIANQNINNFYEILDTENLCGEEDKTVKNETDCCHILADPERNSGEDNALLIRELYDQSRNSEGQSSAETENNFDLLIGDKAKLSHTDRDAINSEMIEDSLKEGKVSFVQYEAKEPIAVKKMITEGKAENVNLISPVQNALLSGDWTDINVQINEGHKQISSETKELDVHVHVTSARTPLLQQYAEDENSLKNYDLRENDTIETITGQQRPFSEQLCSYEFISSREEISEAHQNVDVFSSKTSEGHVRRGKTDENVVPQLTLIQQSKATEMAQISQDVDQRKRSQLESTDNNAQSKQTHGAKCSSMTALDSNIRDTDEVKDAAALHDTEMKGDKHEELSNNECDKLVGEEIPEQRQNVEIGKIKKVLYNRQEEISSGNPKCFIVGQEHKEMTKEPNQLKNSKCLDDVS